MERQLLLPQPGVTFEVRSVCDQVVDVQQSDRRTESRGSVDAISRDFTRRDHSKTGQEHSVNKFQWSFTPPNTCASRGLAVARAPRREAGPDGAGEMPDARRRATRAPSFSQLSLTGRGSHSAPARRGTTPTRKRRQALRLHHPTFLAFRTIYTLHLTRIHRYTPHLLTASSHQTYSLARASRYTKHACGAHNASRRRATV